MEQEKPKDIMFGDKVIKTKGDYTFEGEVRAVFQKRSGVWRCAVENNAGILHIFNLDQVEKIGD